MKTAVNYSIVRLLQSRLLLRGDKTSPVTDTLELITGSCYYKSFVRNVSERGSRPIAGRTCAVYHMAIMRPSYGELIPVQPSVFYRSADLYFQQLNGKN